MKTISSGPMLLFAVSLFSPSLPGQSMHVWIDSLDRPTRTEVVDLGPSSTNAHRPIQAAPSARMNCFTPSRPFDYTKAASLNNNNIYGPIYSVPVSPLGRSGSCGKGAATPASPVPCLPAQVLFNADGTTTPSPGALFLQTGCETGFNRGTLPGKNDPCGGPSVTFSQGRNRYRGPSFVNIDFAIMKNTRVPGWENARLGLGLQFFNFFNHANFGFPDNGSSDGGFGQIFYLEQPPTTILGSTTQANVARRMIQLKAQLEF